MFYSIFACPVSKEQSSEENPPMMLPCGHVLCKVRECTWVEGMEQWVMDGSYPVRLSALGLRFMSALLGGYLSLTIAKGFYLVILWLLILNWSEDSWIA